MLLGVVLILASTTAYNSAPILLALAARAGHRERRRQLLVHVAAGRAGLAGIGLTGCGWVLETLALTRLSLTLARVLSAAGITLLLVLAHRVLAEPLRRREAMGVAAVLVGMVAVAFQSPGQDTAIPGPLQWTVVLAMLTPVLVAPFLVAPRRAVDPKFNAIAAGAGYALSSVFNKRLAELLFSGRLLPLVVVLAAMASAGLLAFPCELRALAAGRAATVEPVIRSLTTVIPILFAPYVFAERWPDAPLARIVFAAGIALTVLGVMVLARSTADVYVEPAGDAREIGPLKSIAPATEDAADGAAARGVSDPAAAVRRSTTRHGS